MQNSKGLLLKDVTKIKDVTEQLTAQSGNPKTALLRTSSMGNSVEQEGVESQGRTSSK